jgi:hypothetical protein
MKRKLFMDKKTPWILAILGVVLIAAALVLKTSDGHSVSCDSLLSKQMLQEGLGLGTDFMLANQRAAGNFQYEYDWLSRIYTDDDSAVRQAGALWGLALIYGYTHDARLIAPLEKSFGFFERASKERDGGARYILYPGETSGDLGAVALVALAHIEYLNAREDELAAEDLSHHNALLEGYLRFLTVAVREDKLFYASYDQRGMPYGAPSSYYDGEALLALAKAARYRGYGSWEDEIKELADAGYAQNVRTALRVDPDSDITKGYYQWSTMAYRELAESGWKDTEKYADRAITLTDWMVDTHQVLSRTRNTAYAFEGIVSAYALAREKGDTRHAEKFRCTIEEGLSRLMTWQVGASYQNDFLNANFNDDVRAKGGIQNASDEAPLRVDVTQHQMHAVILALEELFPD